MQELLIYGGVSLAFAAGWAFRAMTAQQMPISEMTAGHIINTYTDRQKYLASTKANQELSNSNARLTSQNAALKTRLNRIVEAFADQKSGTAKRVVKMALGDAK